MSRKPELTKFFDFFLNYYLQLGVWCLLNIKNITFWLHSKNLLCVYSMIKLGIKLTTKYLFMIIQDEGIQPFVSITPISGGGGSSSDHNVQNKSDNAGIEIIPLGKI